KSLPMVMAWTKVKVAHLLDTRDAGIAGVINPFLAMDKIHQRLLTSTKSWSNGCRWIAGWACPACILSCCQDRPLRSYSSFTRWLQQSRVKGGATESNRHQGVAD